MAFQILFTVPFRRGNPKQTQSPQSRFFLAAVFSADFDDAFTLLYSFMAVEIKGRHLKEVRQAIQNSRCGFIQEYHENEFLVVGGAVGVDLSQNTA